MIYDLNFRRFIGGLLPVSMQGTVTDFLLVLSAPFRSIHFRLLEYRRDKLLRMQYNARAVSLDAMLNDYFADVLSVRAAGRRILVGEGTAVDGIYLYDSAEHLPQSLGSISVTDHQTWSAAPYVIKVPVELQGDINTYNIIDRLAGIYELYGTKHIIRYY